MIPLFGIHSQQPAAAAVNNFPTVVNVTQTGFASNTTQHLVSMPATATAGNLLLMVWSNDGTATTTTPGGWSRLYDASSLARSNVFLKVAAGTEGGTTVDVVTSAIEAGSAQVYQISNWGGQIADVFATTAIGGTGTTRACPALTPAWGAADYLWIVALHRSDTMTVSSLPANFANLTETIGTSGTAGGQTTTGRRLLNASTLSPGNFTISATSTGSMTTATIAVRGVVQAQEYTLFSTDAPPGPNNYPPPRTHGTKIRVIRNGVVRGVRWYRHAGVTAATHVALYQGLTNISGTKAVSGGTASGWQRQDFDSPVSVNAGTIYIPGVYLPGGNAPDTLNFFATAHFNGPLEGIANAESTNGVYSPDGGTAIDAPWDGWQAHCNYTDMIYYT